MASSSQEGRRLPSALEAMELNERSRRAESKAETSNGLNKVREQEGEFGRGTARVRAKLKLATESRGKGRAESKVKTDHKIT